MKFKILLLLLILGIIVAFSLLGTASATESEQQVIPRVNVVSGGSLSIVSGTTEVGGKDVIEFGDMGPGTSKTKTLTLEVTANDAWSLTVSKDQDLTCPYLNNATIPSTNFTFTSNGPGGPTTDTEFGTDTLVATDSSATSSCNVNVVYELVIPSDQPPNDPEKGYYSAFHTYTLIVQ